MAADPSWLIVAKGIATVFAATSAGAVALYGILRGFSRYEEAKLRVEREALALQKRERSRRLKYELALESIDLLPTAEQTIARIRNPMGTNEESEKANEFYNRDRPGILDDQYDPFARLVLFRIKENLTVFERLEEIRPKFRVLFGEDKPFEDVGDCIWELRNVAFRLNLRPSQDMTSDYNVLTSGLEGDEISPKMRQAVLAIEKICRPILQGDE